MPHKVHPDGIKIVGTTGTTSTSSNTNGTTSKERDKKATQQMRDFAPDLSPKNVCSLQSDNLSLWRKIGYRYLKPFRSCASFGDSLISFMPIVDWIPRYSWKRQFYGDFIGGLLFAITNIPQAIAYSLLAGIPPVSGLYSMLAASAVYPLLASWPHGGPAPFSILELMAGATAEEIVELYKARNGTDGYPAELVAQVNPATIVSTLTFTIGIIYLICGIIRIQFLAEYFSAPLVSGFITGAVFHIAIGQLDQVMGVNKAKNTGPGYLLRDLGALYNLAPQTNMVTLYLSGASFLFLVVGKFILHPQIEKCFPNRKIIIPYELILVILATVFADFLKLNESYAVKSIGAIPRDLPVPALPKFFLMWDLIWDALALAIIQAAIHMSVSKMMSSRLGYHVDDNQELFALSGTHLVAGFWPVFPTATSLTGPPFMAECGVTSQLSNIVSGGVVLAVLLAIGPLLHWLPLCVLAIIVIVPLRVLLMSVKEVPKFWRECRWDFCVWVVTFISTVCIDVIGGLAVGIGFELFTIVARTQGPRWNAWYTKETDNLDICVFQFEAMLLFTNGERFKKAVRRVFGRWHTESRNQTRIFIFECSSITEVDSVGLKCFTQILNELRKTDSIIYFVKASNTLIQNLRISGALIKGRYLFSSVDEAISEARMPRKSVSVIQTSGNNFRNLGRPAPTTGF